MIHKCIVKVKGIPFIDTTKCIQMWDLIVKDKDMIVIELTAQTPDAPYGESFNTKEVWIAV
jgi:hypothetical protein